MSSVPIEWFEERYAGNPDPWGFSNRWYESRKYALTVAALPRQRYFRGFEPGCSIGVLTAALAARCDYLLAVDGSEIPLEQARERVKALDQVEVGRLLLPTQWPDGPWDLVVLSEIAYYFDSCDLANLLGRAADTMVTGATLVAVHWRGPTDYPQSGDAVHAAIGEHPAFEHSGGYCETSFRIDVYDRHHR